VSVVLYTVSPGLSCAAAGRSYVAVTPANATSVHIFELDDDLGVLQVRTTYETTCSTLDTPQPHTCRASHFRDATVPRSRAGVPPACCRHGTAARARSLRPSQRQPHTPLAPCVLVRVVSCVCVCMCCL
jgi:hypothetical protein